MSATQRKEAIARLGFYAKRVQTGGRPAIRWACKCSKCGFEETFGWSPNASPEFLEKMVQQLDWRYEHKQLVCGPCVEEAKKEKKEKNVSKIETVPNPKLQRKVFALLDDNFDEDRRLYRAGWSDKKVADEAQTSEQFVASLRKGAYGELAEDPAISLLRADIAALDEVAKSIEDSMLNRLVEVREKITALHTRLDGYAMKKVV